MRAPGNRIDLQHVSIHLFKKWEGVKLGRQSSGSAVHEAHGSTFLVVYWKQVFGMQKENLSFKCQIIALQECLSSLRPLIPSLPQCLPLKCSHTAETPQKWSQNCPPLFRISRSPAHSADTAQQPEPRAPPQSCRRYLLLLSAAHYYCLPWSCSAMETHSPRPCPITFGTIYIFHMWYSCPYVHDDVVILKTLLSIGKTLRYKGTKATEEKNRVFWW